MDRFYLQTKLVSLGVQNLLATKKHKRLLRCIRKRSNAEAISIIDHQVQPLDLFGYKRQTLLHYAVECDNSVIAQHLIGKGWNLEAADADGEIALTVALRRESTDSISVLLDAVRSHFSVRDYIQQAALTFPKDFQMVKLLLDKLTTGCHKNGDIAQTLLALQCPLPVAVYIFKNAELTKLMLDGGCPVDDRLVNTGETALHLAVEYSDIDNVKLLVERGAELEAKDAKDRTPLSRFKMSPSDPDEKLETLRFLLNKGASLTAICKRRRFQMMFYTSQRIQTIQSKFLCQEDPRVVRSIAHSAILFDKDASGKNPYHYLMKNKTMIQNSMFKCPNASTRWGNPWTGLSETDYDWYSKSMGIILITDESLIKNPRQIDKYLQLTYKLYDRSEYAESTDLISLYHNFVSDFKKIYGNSNKYKSYIMFDPSVTNYLEIAKLAVAKLALYESRGVILSESVLEKIEACEKFRDNFQSSKEQIVKMKETTVYESATLYKLLCMPITSLIACARNAEFQRDYEIVKSDIYDVGPTYANLLTARIEKAIVYANKENAAACVLCRITDWPINIVYRIAEYLDLKDLQSLSQA